MRADGKSGGKKIKAVLRRIARTFFKAQPKARPAAFSALGRALHTARDAEEFRGGSIVPHHRNAGAERRLPHKTAKLVKALFILLRVCDIRV